MGLDLIIIFMTFSALTLMSLLIDENRTRVLSRTPAEWLYDGVGLIIQGVMIPALPFLLLPLLRMILPNLNGSLTFPGWIQFLFSFVVVDYLYYWNHRVLHHKMYWSLHRLHHSSRLLDVLSTSRNSLITSFLFVYLWAQMLGMFLLKDSNAFMLGLGLTFALDLYRHSGLKTPEWIQTLLSPFFILSEHHLLHHSLKGRNRNFGANFSIWDKIHETHSTEQVMNADLEKLPTGTIMHELLTPWRKSS